MSLQVLRVLDCCMEVIVRESGIRIVSCVPISIYQRRSSGRRCMYIMLARFDPPTLDVASVKLFNVVLLPAEGLPTRPINGSRGISRALKGIKKFSRKMPV